jgi:hypothetical protein
MSNRLLFIVSMCLLASCFVHRRREYEEVGHIDAQKEGEMFIDSLKSANIDTIVGYFNWSSLGANPHYIFWQNNGNGYLTQITQYAKYNIINRAFLNYVLSTTTIQKLKSEKITTRWVSCDDCPSEQMRIYLGADSVIYDMELIVREANEWSAQIIFIDKFRSFLFGVSPWEWKSLNPKYERIKKRGGYQIWD